jgi:hypothetical protein
MPRRKSRPLRRSEPFLFRAERILAEARQSGISPPSPVRYRRNEPRLPRGVLAYLQIEGNIYRLPGGASWIRTLGATANFGARIAPRAGEPFGTVIVSPFRESRFTFSSAYPSLSLAVSAHLERSIFGLPGPSLDHSAIDGEVLSRHETLRTRRHRSLPARGSATRRPLRAPRRRQRSLGPVRSRPRRARPRGRRSHGWSGRARTAR